MEKLATTAYSLHEFLARRWSPRAFNSHTLTSETLGSLLEAARWSASCFNEQPCRWIVATQENPEDYQKLLQCLNESNIRWAQQAPALLLSVTKLNFTHNEKPNRYAWHDAGQALAHLSIQAMALGLFVHPMAGFQAEKAREIFQIPADYEPVAAVALGYPGDFMSLPEDLQTKELAPRLRRPLEELVFTGSWGQSWVKKEKNHS